VCVYFSGDILLSYSAKQPEVLVGIVAMALKTITTYPILLFCGREAIKSLITECSSCQLHLPRTELTSRIVIAGVWFALTLLLAVFIPDIGEVIKMLGSLAAVFIFILPGLSLFQYAERSDPSFRRKKTVFWMLTSFLFMALGSFIFGVVFTQTIQYNLNDHPSEVPICY
jgi:sodium-coupled neutral amino acid transporter 7/8